MNFITKFLILSLFILPLLSSCKTTVQHLSEQENTLRVRTDYDSYLSLEYLRFARNLDSVGKNGMAKYFARKGLLAQQGIRLKPESPIEWRADSAQMEEMVLLQRKLEEVVYNSPAKSYLPIQTAHLTYLYDCWITRESQPIFRSDELAQCRVRFVRLLDEIETYLDDLDKDHQPKVEIKEPEFKHFEILFDLDSYKFNDRASHDLWDVIKYLKTMNGNYRLLVVGNADRTGGELYNQGLAMSRANVVKEYLTKNGVAKHMIEIRSKGEDFPDIITGDSTQQKANRTVGIYVLTGAVVPPGYPLPLIEEKIYRDEITKARQERGLE